MQNKFLECYIEINKHQSKSKNITNCILLKILFFIRKLCLENADHYCKYHDESKDHHMLRKKRQTVECNDEALNCDVTSPWRTVDGSCNNLANTRWGQSNRIQARFLMNDYDDSEFTLSISKILRIPKVIVILSSYVVFFICSSIVNTTDKPV